MNIKSRRASARKILLVLPWIMLACGTAWSANSTELKPLIDSAYPELKLIYEHLHQNPELSFQEAKTASYLAQALAKRGFEVTQNVGGHGVVAVLKNGEGPVLLIRSDLDALPITEQTQLPFSSTVRSKNEAGNEVGVMHACGHDIHMTSLVGVAEMLFTLKSQWSGTVVLIGQPAEERGAGARAMLADGLFERFPKPNYVLAFHVAGDLEAGKIGYRPGYIMANVDSVDILIHGKGGHGAAPHHALDPIVIASQIVLGLQTIVSREIDPMQSAVVTVGRIQAGTKRNIIPESALLQLTVRSYEDETRTRLLTAIKRISINMARAAGVSEDQLPEITVKDEYTPSLYNDPVLTERLATMWKKTRGEETVVMRKPEMIGEDFSRYGRTEDRIPICMFRVGVARSGITGLISQSLHTAEFSPHAEPTLKTAVLAMTEAALELLPTSPLK